ncbi:hypothetical protein [Spirosoma fluminis]
MKLPLLFAAVMSVCFATAAFAQSNQSPEMQQSTSTQDRRAANPPRPKLKKQSQQQRSRMESGLDTTLPKDRKQKRLRPDSLRRGGATRVDTVRR